MTQNSRLLASAGMIVLATGCSTSDFEEQAADAAPIETADAWVGPSFDARFDPDASPEITQTSVFAVYQSAEVVAGSEIVLTRTPALGDSPSFARFTATTTGTPGHAYTLWFCGFNTPSECLSDTGLEPGMSCGEDDVETRGGFFHQFVPGQIADENGNLSFAGDSQADILTGQGLASDDAEIFFLLGSHGPALSGAELDEQLSTPSGGCPPNECATAQRGGFGAP